MLALYEQGFSIGITVLPNTTIGDDMSRLHNLAFWKYLSIQCEFNIFLFSGHCWGAEHGHQQTSKPLVKPLQHVFATSCKFVGQIRLTICVYQPNKYNIVGKHANKSCAGVSSLNLQHLTIIRRRRGDYRGIFTETKSRWIFPENHRAWGE